MRWVKVGLIITEKDCILSHFTYHETNVEARKAEPRSGYLSVLVRRVAVILWVAISPIGGYLRA